MSQWNQNRCLYIFIHLIVHISSTWNRFVAPFVFGNQYLHDINCHLWRSCSENQQIQTLTSQIINSLCLLPKETGVIICMYVFLKQIYLSKRTYLLDKKKSWRTNSRNYSFYNALKPTLKLSTDLPLKYTRTLNFL